jgi:hypothetical protein
LQKLRQKDLPEKKEEEDWDYWFNPEANMAEKMVSQRGGRRQWGQQGRGGAGDGFG